jgi:hypothetical protein
MRLKNMRKWAVPMVLMAATAPAFAALGGDVASVDADRVRMKATHRMIAGSTYSVQEIQTPAGTTIREYVSPAGKVFGVVWQGPQMPDLKQLFGDYFGTYQDAAKAKRTSRGALRVVQPDIVVHSGGHMRAFFGRAYVPQLVPTGVSIDDIK